MRTLALSLIALLLCTPAFPPSFAEASDGKQDSQDDASEKVLERIYKMLEEEGERLRRELADLALRELAQKSGGPGSTEPRKLIREDLLRKHIEFLSDGRDPRVPAAGARPPPLHTRIHPLLR